MPNKNKDSPNRAGLGGGNESQEAVCWIQPGERLRAGMLCPRCRQAKLEYNGLLQLTCPECGLTETGACT